MAFARDNGANTASTEFYIVIGEAPRRLDRNLTAFGRVIAGMKFVQKLHRGNPNIASGVIQDLKARDKILSVRIAADLPAASRPHYQVMRTTSPAFAKWMAARINPAPGFYVRQPPKILDVCLSPVPVRIAPEK
jgi:peptidylprolyl isomerase